MHNNIKILIKSIYFSVKDVDALYWSNRTFRLKRDCPFFERRVTWSGQTSYGTRFVPILKDGPVLIPSTLLYFGVRNIIVLEMV